MRKARSAAELLEASAAAGFVYDIAKKVARLSKAKGAHDELVGAAHRAQADALELEAKAKRRLADEYDAAQQRREVQNVGGDRKSINVPRENNDFNIDLPSVSDLGLSRKQIHEARLIRDAEVADPGIVERTVNAALGAGEEPTKAKVRRAILRVAAKPKSKPPNTRKTRRSPSRAVEQEPQHDRDVRMLKGVWDGACDSAKAEFYSWLQGQRRGAP